MEIVQQIPLDDAEKLLEFQRELGAVDHSEAVGELTTICGLDVAYDGQTAYACAAILDDRLKLVESVTMKVEGVGDYTPGQFARREARALIAVLCALDTPVDAFIFDAHGTAHPMHFGLASLVGYVFDVATIGCAKNHLFGDYEQPRLTRGSWTAVTDAEATIGAVVRTQDDINPVYVSPGYRCKLDRAVEIVLAVSPEYRIPEPLRFAHQGAERFKRDAES